MADERTEKQKVQEITDKLEEGLKELFESEKYKTYLSTMRPLQREPLNSDFSNLMPLLTESETDSMPDSLKHTFSFASHSARWQRK